MKNNLFLNIFCLSLLFQPFSKAVEIPTKATFVSVQATGVIPIADQSVLVLPCALINANCKEAVEYLTKVVQGSQNLNPVQMQELNQKIRAALYSLRQIEEARTDLKGEVKIPCKAANCLIYTNWTSNENSLFWINLHKSGTIQEYPPSRAIQVKNLRVPEEIIKLNDSISRLKAQLSAGMSYVNLSSSVSPFIQALEAAQNSPQTIDYTDYINESKRISNMLSVLSETWKIYIQSTSLVGFTTTHNVSCKNVKAIRTAWNEAIGYADIGEIKGGVLGCLFGDLGRLSSPYGNTTWPGYMLQAISTKLGSTSSFISQSNSTVQTILIPPKDIQNP
jgi:hypothetical protein